MTCKDCFNFGECLKSGETPHYAVDGCHKDVEKRCKNFKNKADFVEVVRCCECKYCKAITDRDGNGVVYCNRTFAKSDVDPVDFCSYGERKGECR